MALMKTKLQVPSNWVQLLKRFEDAGLDACIAGGALRDLDHNQDVKDLDVWVSAGRGLGPTLAKVSQVMQGAYMEGGSEGMSDGDPCNGLYDARMYTMVPGVPVPVNVMVCKMCGIEQTINTFDFGIVQIGCNADGEVFCTTAYMLDCRNRTFTFLEQPGRDPTRSRRRYDRITSRAYPGWKLVGMPEPKPDNGNTDYADLAAFDSAF